MAVVMVTWLLTHAQVSDAWNPVQQVRHDHLDHA